jgi:hypothetical protein
MPVMTGPQDPGAVGRDRLRAGHADRDQVIETLKVAFVHGRLTKDELNTRAGQALASRTYAELAGLTADLPAGPAVAEPAAEPAGTPARTLAKAARRSGICMLIAFALVGVVALFNAESLVPLAFLSGVAAVIAASGFLGYGVVDAWQERRSRGQLPPRPTQHRRAFNGEQNHGPGNDLILCQARSDARAHHLPGHRVTQPARQSLTVRRARGRLAVLTVTA